MKKAAVLLMGILLFAVVWLQTGCGLRDENPAADSGIQTALVENGTANVNFKLVFPQTDGKPSASIRAALSDVKVTFQLVLVNVGDIAKPTTMIKKVVGVDANGVAVATFTGIPAQTAMGKVHVESGNVQGVTEFRGAADLSAGDNILEVASQGSKLKQDVIAQVIENLIASPTKFAGAPKQLVTEVTKTVNTLNLSSPNIYDDASNGFFNTITGTGTGTDTGTGTSTGTGVEVEFTLPTNYSTSGFPASGSSLAVSGLTSTKKMTVALMNRSDSAVSIALSAALGTSPNKVAVQPSCLSKNQEVQLTAGQKFHLRLREIEKTLPHGFDRTQQSKVIPSARPDAENDQVTFTVSVNNNQTNITATCRKRVLNQGYNNYVNFYLDNADAYDATAQKLITDLNTAWAAIYAKDKQIFGDDPPSGYRSLPNDDVTILLTSKITDSAGFFYSGDMYPAGTPGIGNDTNNRKIFYLAYNTQATARDIASTMAHELQHMINFYQKDVNGLSEDSWLNEAMSGYAEHVNGYTFAAGNQSKALQTLEFLTYINSTSLTVWNGSHANYGEVYLFAVWLAQNYGTSGSVKTLLSSKSIGTACVAAFTGQTFNKIFAQWILALYVNNTAGGLYGYSDTNLRTTYDFGIGLSPVTLSGPKVLSNNAAFPYSSGNITIEPWASAFVEFTGGNGNAVNLTLPTTVSCFELLK